MKTTAVIFLAITALLIATGAGAQTYTVTDMIPSIYSNETVRDAEPNLTVNPNNPAQMVVSVFSQNSAVGAVLAPIWISTNGGTSWDVRYVVPGGFKYDDMTPRFANASNVLYGGILRHDAQFQMNLLRSADFTSMTPMEVIRSRGNEDQPYLEAATVLGGGGAGMDRVYAAHNNGGSAPNTATVEVSLDAKTAADPDNFNPDVVESRAGVVTDGPAVRPAVDPSGTVYTAFTSWTTSDASSTIADVVVVRDDNWASASPFHAIGAAGNYGTIVVSGIHIPYNTTTFYAQLGNQRIGSGIAIAADLTSHQIATQRLYLAYSEGDTAAAYTLHVRRSDDGGVNWSGDLFTVTGATNPALAVNNQGTAAFLYQQLVNSGGNRWQTHVRLSNDGFATAPSDNILANVPDVSAGTNTIGDYDCIRAQGKNFYGVFSAYNEVVAADYPNGDPFQRNHNFGTSHLRNVTNTADVTNSVDPFFFRITVQGDSSDFYVRDWTASASSGDNGVEPSTHGNFYSTSDVWNRRGTLDGTPFPADQPASEDAGNGAATVGDNWMFARIRRNAAAGSATVSAHFLVAKFGTGSSYIDSSDVDPNVTIDGPDPAVMFNAPDLGPLITSAVHWHLDEPAPSHLCIAVEIQSPGDPITGGTLRGHTPGWPGTDLRVLDDNNKAQRNIWHFSNMPARGPGMSDVVYAIAHNGATFQRTMELSYESGGAQIAVAGGKGRVSDTLLYLPEMEPGENRWIEVRVPAGSRRPVRFYEMKGAAAVNGFEVEPAPASFDQVVRERLAYHRSVFTRLAAETHSAAAAEQARLAQKLLEGRDPGAEYVSFVRTSVDALKPLISRWSGSRQYQGDAFGLAAALEALSAAFGSDDRAALPSAHFNLLTRLDSDITDVQLSRGDPADVLQTVTMQRDLFTSVRRLKALAPMVKERSERFIRAYEERKIGNGQYRELLAGLRATFAEAASGNTAATTALAEIDRNMNNVAGLQKSHRAFLLALR